MGALARIRGGNRRRGLASTLMVATALASAFAAAPSWAAQAAASTLTVAQLQSERRFDIPVQPLTDALVAFGQQSGVQVTVNGKLARDVVSPAVSGTMTSEQALRRLLAGSGLIYTVSGSTVAIERPGPQDDDGAIVLDPITVEGRAGPPRQAQIGNLPPAYAGGQVASGGRVGLLGNQDVFDTPFSMTSYTAELIENQHARTVADVIVNDPSVRLANPSRGGSETFSIRGFNTGGNGAELYDGVPGLAHRRQSTVGSLERVEVFKGANALLSGTVGAVGGTVNLVPKRPLEDPITRLTADYEAESRFGARADVSRRFGADDQFGARFSGSYRKGEATIENNDEELIDTSLALDFDADKFRASLVLNYSKQELFGGNQLFLASEIPDAPDTKDAIQQPWENEDTEFVRGLLRMEYDLAENWTLHGAVGASYFEQSLVRTIGLGLDSSGDFSQIGQLRREEETQYSGVAGVSGHFETGQISHSVSLQGLRSGAEGRFARGSIPGFSVSSNIFDPVFVPPPSFAPLSENVPKESETVNQSIAIADTLGFFEDRALFTVGIRHQNVQRKSFDTTTGELTDQYDESAITPALGLLVKPWPSVSLYGNYIESLEQGETAPDTAVNAGESFPPNKTTQFEFGAKYDAGDLGITAGFFQIERPSGFTDSSNRFSIDGEQRNRGIELNVFGEVVPSLRVLGGIAYIDSELTKTRDGEFDGNDGAGVPRLSGVLGVEWDPEPLPGLTLSFRATHTGSQFTSNDNTLKLSSHQIYSIGARYEREIGDRRVTIRASVDNILDEDYWTTFAGSSRVLYVGTPRIIALSASIDF